MPSRCQLSASAFRIACSLMCALLISACTTFPPPKIGNETMPITNVDRDMAMLSFVAYVGADLRGSDSRVEHTLAQCLPRELARQPALANRWTLEWGPVVYKFHSAKLDDNMLFVVSERGDPKRQVVVVRGTNPDALLDWLREDFDVGDSVAWRYGTPPQGLHPRLSRATSRGLSVLTGLAPASGLPHAGRSIDQYLRTAVFDRGVDSIAVVGHSLGGALAPTLALWLEDERRRWDPELRSKLSVFALAGPTPGNADFASYYDARLGAATRRFHDPYDIVPRAWNVADLRTIPRLYETAIEPHFEIELLTTAVIDRVREQNYAQLVATMPRIRAGIYKQRAGFLEQAEWQHHFGYVCGMALHLNPVSSDCRLEPHSSRPPPCPVMH